MLLSGIKFLGKQFLVLLVFFFFSGYSDASEDLKQLFKAKYPKSVKILYDSTLADGIQYRKLSVKNGRFNHNVHLIEADFENPDCSLAVMLSSSSPIMASMLPGFFKPASYINLPLSRTNIVASDKLSALAATMAVYSPKLCPATK